MNATHIKKPLLEVLNGKKKTVPPMWLMRQAGRYLPEYRKIRAKAGDFLNLCYTPEYAAEVTLQPIRRFGFDAAIIFSDILVVPHALGQKLKYIEGEGPVLSKVETARQIKALEKQIPKITKNLSPVAEALTRVKKELPPETALIGFAGAPWTVATYMVEGGGSKHFEHVKTLSYKDPKAFSALIETLVEATADYLIMQVEAGAEVLQIFDSWAGVLDEKSFQRWVNAPTSELVRKVRKACPDIPIIGFPKGAGLYYKNYVRQVRPDAIGLDYTVPAEWAAEKLQRKLPVQGNLDPTILLSDKTTIANAVKHLRRTLGDAPYIFNLGHGILPQTPIQNVEWLVRQVRGR